MTSFFPVKFIMRKFLIILIYIVLLLPSNNLNSSEESIDDFGIISIMYHRFEENKYPSTNIKMEIFKKHIEIIKQKKYRFYNPKNFSLEFKNIKKEKKIYKSNFNYIIKIADFYFIKSAKQMKSRIVKETTIKKVQISKITNTKFRVFLGPYDNLNSLKKSFNAINVLGFDSIEIIKK